MKRNLFYAGLLALFISLSFWILFQNPIWSEIIYFLFFILIFLAIVDLMMFEVGHKLKKSNNPYQFTRFFMIMVFVKMMLFVGIILIGVTRFYIEKKAFIIPSLVFYLLFTIHETYFLMAISKKS